MNILGISAYYHDSAACLISGGKIVAAMQEERFSRKKHDARFPELAIRHCLEQGQISPADIDLTVFYEQSRLKFDRLFKTYLSYAPWGMKSFLTAMPLWLRQKLWLRREIFKKLGIAGEFYAPTHHQSHAASAFFPSPFHEAAIITMDAVGEWTTLSVGRGAGNQLTLLKEIRFPHSLGLLYSAFTYYTGFRVNSGEYKLMGLAPYGEPRYVDLIFNKLLDLKADGSFRLDMRYFNYCTGFTMTNERFHKLFKRSPRKPETEPTQLDMDLASSIQKVTEEIVLRIGRYAHDLTGLSNLCLAGGVALNCVANGRLYREGPFERIWIQPAAGDAGGAIGAALYAWHCLKGKHRQTDNSSDLQSGSYLGTAYTDEQIRDFLYQQQAPYQSLDEDELPGIVADIVASEKVVGWFQGRMEFGPRALGARSIIGDARSAQMQTVMNLKIKYRESFRPFAPSVLRGQLRDWFQIEGNRPCSSFDSPYMLMVGQVAADKLCDPGAGKDGLQGIAKLKAIRSVIPAVTHVDCSARVQTVHPETNPRYHAMIEAFNQKTNCPVIINTSFNVRGEPIVESPEDAYRCFMRTEMDYLVMGNCLLDKLAQPEFIETRDWLKEFALD